MRLVTIPLLASALCSPAMAQERPAGSADPRAGIRVDTVVATINDDVIMLSELRTLVVVSTNTIEAQQRRRLTNDERAHLIQAELNKLIQDRTMAQAAKTLGLADPAMIESLFQDELRREAAEQVRNLGTEQKFSQELQRQGRTWQSFEREQRAEKMRDFAEELSIRARLQRQQNLFLTPRMMQELYRREIDRFVRPAMAIVGAVVFRGDQAAEHAAQAIELWRQEDLTSRALADRFPAALSLGENDASTLDPGIELTRFALAGPQGTVSAAMPTPGGLQVAKVIRFEPAANGRFEDPAVQVQLRRIGLDKVVGELRQQALERAAARTEVVRIRPQM